MDNEFFDLLRNQLRDLKSFIFVYISYTVLVVVISFVIIFLLFFFTNEVFPKVGGHYVSFLTDPVNVKLLVYVSVLFIVVMASVSYIANIYLKRIESTKQLGDDAILSTKLDSIESKLNISLNSSKLNIISYKDLIDVESSYECIGIYIITNSLADDLNDNHFFNAIIENLIKGKKYKFIVPKVASNRRDGCALLGKLSTKLNEKGLLADISKMGEICEVYLVLDEVFRICAFRDVAIYGASINEYERLGYVELPYIGKDKDPNDRFFIQIDNNVCGQIASDIDTIIQNSEYVEALSCELSSA